MIKYTTDFWYSRAIWEQCSRTSSVASKRNSEPIDDKEVPVWTDSQERGWHALSQRELPVPFQLTGRENCPLRLKKSIPSNPRSPGQNLSVALSRAESIFATRRRGAVLHMSILGWGDHASLGKARKEFSPHSCAQNPCHVSLTLAVDLPQRKPTHSSALELSVQPHPIESSLRTLPCKFPTDTSLKAQPRRLYNGLCLFQIPKCLSWFYFNEKDCSASHYRHIQNCPW